jgi:fermentation-respiration switch protein FrsA (DUF1100 family)
MPFRAFDRIFYYPDRRTRGSPADAGVPCEEVSIPTAGGLCLHGWFLPPAGPSRGTVLHLHGNAANVTAHHEFIDWLPARGYGVLSFDYRGYGRSEGSVSRQGTLEDASAALDYLRRRPGVDSRRILLFGQSIGGAIAVVLAARRRADIAAVAVDSAFTSHRQVVQYHVTHHPVLLLLGWWFPFCIADGLDPIDHVAAVSPVPLLVVHGTNDRIVPTVMGRRLFEAAGEPREAWWVEGAGHMEAWFDRPGEAHARLVSFFERALAGPGQSAGGRQPPLRSS